jgi:hypothetical protein
MAFLYQKNSNKSPREDAKKRVATKWQERYLLKWVQQTKKQSGKVSLWQANIENLTLGIKS